MIYNTVKKSIQLQYVIELGAQKLIPVHPRSPNVSTKECLHILRAKANAWNSFELGVMKRLSIMTFLHPESIAHRQLYLSAHPNHPHSSDGNFISQVINPRTCTPEIASAPHLIQSQDSLHPAGTPICNSYMDAVQDLVIIINIPDKSSYCINFRTISTGEKHPLAPGSIVVARFGPDDLDEYDLRLCETLVTVFGDRLAFYGSTSGRGDTHWSLHVWNWHKKAHRNVCA